MLSSKIQKEDYFQNKSIELDFDDYIFDLSKIVIPFSAFMPKKKVLVNQEKDENFMEILRKEIES